MQNVLKCLANDAVGSLEGSMFIDTSLPNICIFSQQSIYMQQQAKIGEKFSKS